MQARGHRRPRRTRLGPVQLHAGAIVAALAPLALLAGLQQPSRARDRARDVRLVLLLPLLPHSRVQRREQRHQLHPCCARWHGRARQGLVRRRPGRGHVRRQHDGRLGKRRREHHNVAAQCFWPLDAHLVPRARIGLHARPAGQPDDGGQGDYHQLAVSPVERALKQRRSHLCHVAQHTGVGRQQCAHRHARLHRPVHPRHDKGIHGCCCRPGWSHGCAADEQHQHQQQLAEQRSRAEQEKPPHHRPHALHDHRLDAPGTHRHAPGALWPYHFQVVPLAPQRAVRRRRLYPHCLYPRHRRRLRVHGPGALQRHPHTPRPRHRHPPRRAAQPRPGGPRRARPLRRALRRPAPCAPRPHSLCPVRLQHPQGLPLLALAAHHGGRLHHLRLGRPRRRLVPRRRCLPSPRDPPGKGRRRPRPLRLRLWLPRRHSAQQQRGPVGGCLDKESLDAPETPFLFFLSFVSFVYI